MDDGTSPDPGDRLRRLQSRLDRERRARIEAEELLEVKSRQLYKANVALGRLAADLERRVAERTHELTEARHHALRQAETDALTGLANRAAFLQRLEHALADRDATRSGAAVLLLDLDDFKTVNDTLGHGAGDTMLVEVARRLAETCRPGDVVARLGGDEFAVLACGVGGGRPVAQMAHRLLVSLGRPVELQGRLLACGCSIGIATVPPEGMPSGILLADADLALYASKRAGRGRVTTFEPTLRIELERRAAREADVRQAVRSGRIHPWYQPVRRCAIRRFVGAELLARWHREDGTVRGPADFLDTVDSLGLLDLMMENMLAVALREAAPCVADGKLEYLSINISPQQFSQGWLLNRLPELARQAGFPAAALVVEITETALLQDLDRSRATLDALNGMGIGVAMDDFGVGFSNFSILRLLRFRKLKVDRSLVCDIETDQNARAIVLCILELAKRLRIHAIAEGVETEGQARILEAAGCSSLQGYLFAHPGRRLESWF